MKEEKVLIQVFSTIEVEDAFFDRNYNCRRVAVVGFEGAEKRALVKADGGSSGWGGDRR